MTPFDLELHMEFLPEDVELVCQPEECNEVTSTLITPKLLFEAKGLKTWYLMDVSFYAPMVNV